VRFAENVQARRKMSMNTAGIILTVRKYMFFLYFDLKKNSVHSLVSSKGLNGDTITYEVFSWAQGPACLTLAICLR